MGGTTENANTTIRPAPEGRQTSLVRRHPGAENRYCSYSRWFHHRLISDAPPAQKQSNAVLQTLLSAQADFFYTFNLHGLRYSRDRRFEAALSPSIFSVSAFHTIRRPERNATFPSKHAVVERCPISMSEVGLCRDLTQSRKLRTCVSPCLFSFFTRRASTF